MIFVQNSVFITGVIGFLLVHWFFGVGNYLYLHRVFSYNRKKNLSEVYQHVGVETICVSGVLSLLYKALEIGELLEPMGISGLLVIVWMVLLAGLICHGYISIFRGDAIIVIMLSLFFVSISIIYIFWSNIQSNLYLRQIAVALLIVHLSLWGLHLKLWRKADFV